ncbi:MAG: Tol-Pal system beta propeller repeat protein TolB [Pseudomonadota bacterium]
MQTCTRIWTIVVMWLVSTAGVYANTLDPILIDRGVDEPTRIAVVPFRLDAALDSETNLSDIIAFDLARSGQFSPIEHENMLSYPTSRQEVFFRDWRILKAAYLVIGQARSNADGSVTATFELFDVVAERNMEEFSVTASRDEWRTIAHKLADQIYAEITGIRGAFATKLMYVLAQNSGTRDATYRLEIADSDGERSKTLLRSREPILSASWSPDGKRVVYVTFETGRPTIVIQDVEGPYRERITNFQGLNSSPIFSPDGRSLAMVLSKDGDPEIFVMDLATRQLRQVTRNRAIDTEPSWSPDGRSIVFTSDRGGAPQIYQLELSTNFLERLTFKGDYNARARLMPDGKHLVFVHRRNGVFHIAWQDLERDNLQVLTETALDESPSLAPNGTMLIYATQDQGRGILAVVSIDGRVRYRLPSSSGDVREPAWSPYLDD